MQRHLDDLVHLRLQFLVILAFADCMDEEILKQIDIKPALRRKSLLLVAAADVPLVQVLDTLNELRWDVYRRFKRRLEASLAQLLLRLRNGSWVHLGVSNASLKLLEKAVCAVGAFRSARAVIAVNLLL